MSGIPQDHWHREILRLLQELTLSPSDIRARYPPGIPILEEIALDLELACERAEQEHEKFPGLTAFAREIDARLARLPAASFEYDALEQDPAWEVLRRDARDGLTGLGVGTTPSPAVTTEERHGTLIVYRTTYPESSDE